MAEKQISQPSAFNFGSGMVTNVLLILVLFFGLVGTCTNVSVNKVAKNTNLFVTTEFQESLYIHDSLLLEKFKQSNDVQNQQLREEIQEDFDFSLYNFLIYEDDLDRGKISLSEIRNLLLEKNDEKNNENNTK